MSFLTEHASVIAWGAFLLIIFIALKGLKDQGGDFKYIKDWSSRESWKGEVKEASLISWNQTNTMNNVDYYFIFKFEITGGDIGDYYQAAAVVKVSDVSKLHKGMKIHVKVDGMPPKKTAVLDEDYQS